MSRKNRAIQLENNGHKQEEEPLVLGGKRELRAKTEGQQAYIDTIIKNIITLAIGPAGSGKTTLAVGLAIEALRKNKIDKIVISRPIIGAAGEELGSLPGSVLERVHPYMRPVLDEIKNYASKTEMERWIREETIEIIPLAIMRGLNFHNSYVVVDEAQNATFEQIQLVLTRLGKDSKIIISGDLSQSDLAYNKRGAIGEFMDLLEGLEGIGIVELTKADIVRNPFISKIIDRIDKYKEDLNGPPPRYFGGSGASPA